MILETEERELLQRQIDRITFVDEAPDKNTPLPTEERELMEDFRNKLVQEMEEFNQNVDKTLKVAGELRLERESADGQPGVIDLEKDGKEDRDMFTQSYTNFEFKGPDKLGNGKKEIGEPGSSKGKEDEMMTNGVPPI